MPREPNAVDFWRGFALITIFIDHVPGIFYAQYTLANFSISDAADLFVFLAGWSLRLMAEGGSRRRTTGEMVMRLFGRAFEIYTAQILITMLAIAILAASAMVLHNPLLLQWHNAAAVFNDPVPAHIGLVVLSHQLGYFDILPLYVVLMAMAPAFAVLDRLAPALAAAGFARALSLRARFPHHAAELAGERHLVLQSARLAARLRARLPARQARPRHRPAGRAAPSCRCASIGVPIVILGVLVTIFGWWPDPTKVPNPKLFFIASKAYVSPMRLIQFLALVAVFSLAYRYIRMLTEFRYARAPVNGLIGLFAMLGRNSLYVFCVGSLLSLSAQVVRYVYHGTVGSDTAVVILGIAVMAFTAWLAESQSRARPPAPAVSAPRS